jgi:hypothetical protein
MPPPFVISCLNIVMTTEVRLATTRSSCILAAIWSKALFKARLLINPAISLPRYRYLKFNVIKTILVNTGSMCTLHRMRAMGSDVSTTGLGGSATTTFRVNLDTRAWRILRPTDRQKRCVRRYDLVPALCGARRAFREERDKNCRRGRISNGERKRDFS